jgi:hypothetical protein
MPRALPVSLRMDPDWNRAQTLKVKDRTLLATASPYDFPESFSVEADGGKMDMTLTYDFQTAEKNVVEVEPKLKVRIFRGERSGRVMRIEVVAVSVADAVKALHGVASVLHDLAQKAKQNDEPPRHFVHLGMLEHAIPLMAPVIEERLKAMRSSSSA